MALIALPSLACESKSTATPSAVGCGTDNGAQLAACVSTERYTTDLTFVAQPRPPLSAHWQAVQDLCANRFTELGYQVERQQYATGVNVTGQRVNAGGSKHVLVSAHYDHISNCAGADDNATGVAALLEAARVLSTANIVGTLTLACWDEEERGLLGSSAYAARALAAGTPITVAVSYEMLGYRTEAANSQQLPSGFGLLFADATAQIAKNNNRGDFIAVIADDSASAFADHFATQAAALGLNTVVGKVPSALKSSSQLAALRRSDHASFWDRNYPAVMLTDTAEFRNPHYHCTGGPDVPADLDHAFTSKIIGATVAAVASTLSAP